MHGGLSPDLVNLSDILRIQRPTDVPDKGLVCDLLWSDPDKNIQNWGANDRGVSYTFGKYQVSKFLNHNKLELICRAHQVVQDGYEFFGDRDFVTVFSAPDYCDQFGNKAAVMNVDAELKCGFELLEPVNKFLFESPKIKQFFKQCQAFEELFPFKHVTISEVWACLAPTQNQPLTTTRLLTHCKLAGWDSLNNSSSAFYNLIHLPELRDEKGQIDRLVFYCLCMLLCKEA